MYYSAQCVKTAKKLRMNQPLIRMCKRCGTAPVKDRVRARYCQPCGDALYKAQQNHNIERRKSPLVEKTCAVCGTLFETRRIDKVLCGNSHCRYLHHRKKPAPKTCSRCGVSPVPEGAHKYCGSCAKSATAESNRNQYKKRMTINKKKCPVCKKEFETSHAGQLLCGDSACKRIQNKTHKRTISPKVVLICSVCGKRFPDTGYSIQTCGNECKEKLKAKTAGRNKVLTPDNLTIDREKMRMDMLVKAASMPGYNRHDPWTAVSNLISGRA